MTKLLCRLFVKNRENIKDPAVRRAYGTLTSAVGIILNIVLAVFKLIAGTLSGSISVTADAVNNLSDAGSQIISLISFKISAKPADRDHPFGHARMEYVASMIVSFIILTIGIELFKSSLDKVIHPERTELALIPVIILVVSIAVKLWIAIFNRKISKKINSTIMKATSVDSLSDAVATTAVLASMIISHFTGFITDGYMGIIVSLFIFVAGIRILAETKNSILGGAPDPEVVEEICRICNEYEEILGIHDMIVHNYGAGNTIASLHAEVDGNEDIYHLHDTIDNVEKDIGTSLGIMCTIHLDPIVTNDERTNELFTLTKGAVKAVNESIGIHDFRVVEGTTHTNLIFDIEVPFEVTDKLDVVVEKIKKSVSMVNENFYCVITVDRC